MKVFISSVRRGLEQERDSLPGLVRAVGHEPLRFEDFTAQSVPSREACLQGVADSDVYLLLLGPHYGTTFPETGLSPTHEEFTAALTKGIPRLVFRKDGIEFDAQQTAFSAEIESYGTGVFRASFTDAVDLQAKVAEALRDLPAGPLKWYPLPEPPLVSWRSEWPDSQQRSISRAELSVHAIPTEPVGLSRRQLGELPAQMAGRLRTLGIVPTSSAIHIDADATCAVAALEDTDTMSWREADQGALLGCRIDANGQRSTWERLPSDSMGSILDSADLTERIARDLRLIGALAPPNGTNYAIAVELVATRMTTVGAIAHLGQRTSVTGLSMSDRSVQVEPDESVTLAAFDTGADEVAAILARQVINSFSRPS